MKYIAVNFKNSVQFRKPLVKDEIKAVHNERKKP